MEIWERKKRTARPPKEEVFNREGHWSREFSVRVDAWPMIEHWAKECGYDMVASRGPRRLYQKMSGTGYVTVLDIKQNVGRVSLSSWIQVSWLLRLATLFMVGAEMNPEPGGWFGMIKKREACRELNSLLQRLRQAPILGTDGFHPADIDPSTLILGGLLPLPIVAFVLFASQQMRIAPGLSHSLLSAITRHALALGLGLIGILLAYDRLLLRRLETALVKGMAIAGLTLAFSVLSIFVVTQTNFEMNEAKVTYYCVHHLNPALCREAMDAMPLSQREAMVNRLLDLQKQLSLRLGPTYGPPEPIR